MPTVKEHYDNLLADHYTWMSGGFAEKMRENEIFFRNHGIAPELSGIAIDLGAGSGFQSMALARAGYKVFAIDLCQILLDELNERKGGLDISTICDDLAAYPDHLKEKVELVVCMGDTLTHIGSLDRVEALLAAVNHSLQNSGHFILTFRDLTYRLEDTERFIPVRCDENQIFTCFLEYEVHHVKVHDLVYLKQGDSWELHKSYYRKLIIPPDWLRSKMEAEGFHIAQYASERGMITIIGQRKEH